MFDKKLFISSMINIDNNLIMREREGKGEGEGNPKECFFCYVSFNWLILDILPRSELSLFEPGQQAPPQQQLQPARMALLVNSGSDHSHP